MLQFPLANINDQQNTIVFLVAEFYFQRYTNKLFASKDEYVKNITK